MRLQLPPMPELTAFVFVARSGCITAAAQSLDMTQGGVSRSIKRLESRLGVALFLRNGRGVTLTDTGRQLLERIEPSLDSLSVAMRSVDPQALPRDRLTVRSASTLATRWLIPKLPEFNALAPNVRVVLQPYGPADDFLDPQTDCWIAPRLDKTGPWPRHLLTKYLAGRHIVPICHPSLASALRQPEDLLRHPLLYHLEQPQHWKTWLDAQGVVHPFAMDSGFSTVASIIDAVANNFGIGLVPRCLLASDLESRRVALPFPRPVSTAGGYYLCLHRGRADDPTLRAFAEWLPRRAHLDLHEI